MTLKMIRRGKQKVKEDEQSAETQMEGISSAHSWIKSNTMLRPTKLGKKKASGGGIEEQRSIMYINDALTKTGTFEILMVAMTLTRMMTRQTS